MAHPEPFLRWAGGKRQLVDLLLDALPEDFDLSRHRFYEPFIGGGALTFALAHTPAGTRVPTRTQTRKNRPLVIGDVNDELTNLYETVRDRVDELIEALTDISADTSRDAYYQLRDHSPTNHVDRAARTLALNRLSFNGLYRVNSHGRFNVPYGDVKNPKVCDPELLRACSAWLQHADIRHGPFSSTVSDAQPGDVVYLDPPYLPLTATASFSRYAINDFGELDHYALDGVIRGLCERGVRVILSNSNTPATRHIFSNHLNLYVLVATRSISARATSRKPVEEVLGLNYPPEHCANPERIKHLSVAAD